MKKTVAETTKVMEAAEFTHEGTKRTRTNGDSTTRVRAPTAYSRRRASPWPAFAGHMGDGETHRYKQPMILSCLYLRVSPSPVRATRGGEAHHFVRLRFLRSFVCELRCLRLSIPTGIRAPTRPCKSRRSGSARRRRRDA